MVVIKDCQKIYKNGNVGLEKINLSLPSKGLVGIYGKSGSGKSTLINCLGGLDEFTSGEIYLDNVLVKSLFEYSSYIFQEYKLIEDLSVMDNLLLSNKNFDIEKINEYLKRFAIYDLKDNKVNSISGGQRQRVEIVRAIIQNSSIILCDEPIANVDDETGAIILELLKELSSDKLIIIVSHNVQLLNKYSSKLIEIENGQIKSNSNLENTDLKSNYKKLEPNKLSSKYSLSIALNNIKRNKFKALMTFVFLFLSLSILSIIFSILWTDLSSVLYTAYNNKNAELIVYREVDEEERYPSNYSVSDKLIDETGCDVVIYEYVNFVVKYDDDNCYFNYIWVFNEDKSLQYNLGDNQVIISSNFLDFFGKTKEEVINTYLKYNNEEYIIIDVIDTNKYERTLIINENTFKVFNGNVHNNNYVSLLLDQNDKKLRLFNPYLDNELELLSGDVPTNSREIVISRELVSLLNYNESEIIGKNISLNFFTTGSHDKLKNYESIEYEVVGISRNMISIYQNDFDNFITKFGTSKITSSLASIGYFDYNKTVLRKCIDLHLLPVDEEGSLVYDIYYNLVQLTPFLWGLALVFIIIAIFTIFNSTTSSINQNKKMIGVFISFKMKQKSFVKIYLFENIFICLLAIIISMIIYLPMILTLNSMLKDSWSISYGFLQANFLLFGLLFACVLLVLIISLFLPIRRLLTKKPMDILYDRD